jgi:hypothetical protein
MKLKSLVLAAMLAAGSMGMAQADDNWSETIALAGGPTAWTTSFGHAHTVLGNFTDTYTFTYSGAAGDAFGFFGNLKNPVGDINFSSASLDGTAIPTLNFGPISGSAFVLVPVAGAIELIIKGSTVSGVASYAGTLSVLSAVPEPATYGMMLGGLALLGVAARRRKQS